MSPELALSAALARLRAGEVIAGAGGALLLGVRRSGHQPVVGALLRITGASGVALTYFQATRRAPALPVALSVIVTALGGASTVAVLARSSGAVLDDRQPSRMRLVGALATAAGGYASMRQEGGTDLAALGELETITL
jgi:hypothetical protein